MEDKSKTHLQAKASGTDPVIEEYKKQIDRTLIRENLRLTVEERFEKLMRMQQFAQELRQAGKKLTREQ